MREIFIAFWRIVLMKDGPQDLPDSQPLLVATSGLYAGAALLSYIVSALAESAESASDIPLLVRLLIAICADLGFIVGFMWLLLFYFGRLGRFRQSLTAVLGTGAIFSLLVIPCMGAVVLAESLGDGSGPGGVLAFAALIGLILLVLWSLTVLAHIISSTVAKSFGIGVALAALSFFLNYQLFQYLVPGY